MTAAPRAAGTAVPPRSDRRQRWIAALATALLHGLLIWLAMLATPVNLAEPEGADAGGALQVVYIDETQAPPPATPAPAPPPAPAAAATSRVQTTLVAEPADAVRPEDDAPAERPAPPRPRAPAPTPSPPAPPTPPVEPVDTPPPPAATPDASTAQPVPRPRSMRGQPPGTLPRATAPAGTSAGASPRAGAGRGRASNPGSTGSSMEVDGYQVIYELISEDLLREWRDQGITELFLPLPGTRRLMVCPLEVALRRGASDCRMVEPDDPELATIGDARKALLMQRVYRLGQPLWRGPGPYR